MRTPAPSAAAISKAQQDVASGVHSVLAWSLVRSPALLLAVMVKQEFNNCDQILTRMIYSLLRPQGYSYSVSNNADH